MSSFTYAKTEARLGNPKPQMSYWREKKKWLPLLRSKKHLGGGWRELGQRGQPVPLHPEVEASYMSIHKWALKAQTWGSTPIYLGKWGT